MDQAELDFRYLTGLNRDPTTPKLQNIISHFTDNNALLTLFEKKLLLKEAAKLFWQVKGQFASG